MEQEAAAPDVNAADAATGLGPQQSRLEAGFGMSLGAVQVTSGDEAAQLAGEQGAAAYAIGDDMILPDGGEDAFTLAHEAAHVVQQRGGTGGAGDPEMAADAAAKAFVGGADQLPPQPAAPIGVARIPGKPPGPAPAPASTDPIVASIARGAAKAQSLLVSVPGLLDSFQVAMGSINVDSVAVIGLKLGRTYEDIELTLSSADMDVMSAETLGPVGLGFDSVADPDGAKAAARDAELAKAKEKVEFVRATLGEWKILLANKVRPTTFRMQPVLGAHTIMPPPDLGAHIQEQTVKAILLLDTLREVVFISKAAETAPPDIAEATSKVAAGMVHQWVGDQDGFLFLTHALRELDLSGVLMEKAPDGKPLWKVALAVSRGVPQTFPEMIDTIRDAKERALDPRVGPMGDQEGAARLVELAQERQREIVRYDLLRDRVPDGTHGLTLDQAWELAQTAQSATDELWRMVKRGEIRPGVGGDRLWDHQLKQIRLGEVPLKVLSGEEAYENTFLAGIGPASQTSVQVTVALGTVVIGAPALIEAAPWIVARLGALAEMASAAFASAVTWTLANPQAALVVAEFIASIGLNIGENGVDGFLEQLKTPEGLLQIVMDALVLWASMGGPRGADAPDAPDAPSPSPARRNSAYAEKALEIYDKAKATKQAVLDYAESRMKGSKAAATAGGPAGARVPAGPDDLPDFSTVYAEKLKAVRGARAARGDKARWASPEAHLDEYQAPPPDQSPAQIREQLLQNAKQMYPDDPTLPHAQQAEMHHKQSQYFEKVEAHARNRREDLQAELADAPPERREWLEAEIRLAQNQESAAMVRPAQGRLPINHELAGGEVTIDDIDARLADLTLNAKTRATLQEARKVMVESGRTRVRYKDNGYVDLGEWTLEVNGKKAAYPGPLSMKNRSKDDILARNWYREEIGDPRWNPPENYTWHHTERAGEMILVPTSVHDAFKHTGGIPLARMLSEDYDAYR